MTISASKPISLNAIQTEFSVASLGAAGIAYLSRRYCSMIEFLGASANTYNFFSFGNNYVTAQDYTSDGTTAQAGCSFSDNGTLYTQGRSGVPVTEPPYFTANVRWQTNGSAIGVQAYITRVSIYSFDNGGGSGSTSIGGVIEPTLNTWIPINQAAWNASAIAGEDYLRRPYPGGAGGEWLLSLRTASGVSIINNISITVAAESSGGNPGGSFFYYG